MQNLRLLQQGGWFVRQTTELLRTVLIRSSLQLRGPAELEESSAASRNRFSFRVVSQLYLYKPDLVAFRWPGSFASLLDRKRFHCQLAACAQRTGASDFHTLSHLHEDNRGSHQELPLSLGKVQLWALV